MGDLFKALTSGLSRFVYAWLMPSVIAVGVFVLVLMDDASRTGFSLVGGAAAFVVTVLGLSLVCAYAGRPIYQFLEGYTMPRWMARPLRRANYRRFLRLKYLQDHGDARRSAEAAEMLKTFPHRLDLVMPTRLGNALRGLETYSYSRFGLDSQTFWYELRAVASDKVREATEETRAAVDFFLSSIVHLCLLFCAALATAASGHGWVNPLAVGLACVALLPLAYLQAVRNVIEWRYAVQAMVNTSRSALADSLGVRIPATLRAEAQMWKDLSEYVQFGTAVVIPRIDAVAAKKASSLDLKILDSS